MTYTHLTPSSFINDLKELSKKHNFSTNLTIALSQNKILLHLSSIYIELNDIDDYRTVQFDTIKQLKDDLNYFLGDICFDNNQTCYLTATIPNAIVERDPYDNLDMYSNYDLFDEDYNSKSKSSLTIEQNFDAPKSNIEHFNLLIEDGQAKLQHSYNKAKIYQFQYNLELVDTLNQIMENPYQYVSTSQLEDDSDKLFNNINRIYHNQDDMNKNINSGQVVTHKTLTFNYMSESYKGQMTGIVYNTFYVSPDYNKLNGMKYKKVNKNVPMYHSIIRNHANLRTTFGYKYQPSLSPFNLRKMNDCENTYEQTLTKVFDSDNFKFDQMRQIYIDITKPTNIDQVLVDLGTYYFLSRNELVAQVYLNVDDMNLSYSDLEKDEYKEELMKTVQNFITRATK
jgi:hypothetical protein